MESKKSNRSFKRTKTSRRKRNWTSFGIL
jgi:hypothetical protein